MIRMVTWGLELPRIEAILCKAMSFLKTPPSEFNSEIPGSMKTLARVPHPKSILCSMLECAEEFCKTQVIIYRNRIEKIESGINAQRDTGYSQPRGLEINYVKLSDASIKLSEVRQKVQYSLSLIASLEEMTGLPAGCSIFLAFSHNPQSLQDVSEEPQDQLYDHWWHQLEEARVRLIALKGNCQQHNISIENLQERVRGILSIVSILLAARENEWGRQAQIQRQETSANQLAIIRYQTKMLEQQEIVVAQTKRDNTVMKVIAVLSALFLPGTFIATLFSVPVFNWDQENPIGPHFKTYWYFTAPITTVLVVGLSAWLLKMRYDDRLQEKRRKEREKEVEETT
ncbi:hypothetical protein N431DRAFT_325981 [Stipitochalara longipes BDJ]|nr:hypothetical protein N431DRAFT_325981 [Stipitochalara longipes BDJ]